MIITDSKLYFLFARRQKPLEEIARGARRQVAALRTVPWERPLKLKRKFQASRLACLPARPIDPYDIYPGGGNGGGAAKPRAALRLQSTPASTAASTAAAPVRAPKPCWWPPSPRRPAAAAPLRCLRPSVSVSWPGRLPHSELQRLAALYVGKVAFSHLRAST